MLYCRRMSLLESAKMAGEAELQLPNADLVRQLAQARGLARAHALFPESVVAAAERAARTLASRPAGLSPLTEPAPHFDAGRFGACE
jgi:hypothetical protein